MPDLTPTRPADAAPVATDWGQAVHDMLEGIQTGFVDIVMSAASTATSAIVFPRAYASTPTVLVSVNSASTGVVGKTSSTTPPTTTGFTAAVVHVAGTNVSATIRLYWIAIGTPA